MPEQINSEHERAVRRIARDALWDDCEIDRLETVMRGRNEGDVMLKVDSAHESGNRNAFAGKTLEPFIEEGYLPVSVGGGGHGMTAWFKPIGVGLDLSK